MHRLSTHVSIEIPVPAAELWDVVTDYPTDLVWRKGITEMRPDRPGKPAVGTHVREVLRLLGREYVTDTVVTRVGPAMSYGFEGTGTSGVVRGRRRVVPADGDRALFAYDVQLEPDGIPRVARPILRWWLEHSLRRDVRRLRSHVLAARVTRLEEPSASAGSITRRLRSARAAA